MAGSLRSRWLGQAMRGLREERGMTIRHVAEQVGIDFAITARFERGEELLGQDRIVALLDLYLVFDRAERDRLLGLARAAWRPPIFDALDGDHDPSFLDLLWLEQTAERIRSYSPTVVPDLLQLAAGVDIAIVSKRLRHSSIKITNDTYGHLIGTVGRDAAEAAAALVPLKTRKNA